MYEKLDPTGSSPGKFYGPAKLLKIKINDSVDERPMRPIVSNIGTPTYQLSNALSTLPTSEYTVISTKDFIEKVKNLKIPNGCKVTYVGEGAGGFLPGP